MKRKTVTAHCLVKNEARFVWFSVMSVINHVDQILLWDTGSRDGTIEIIEEIRKADKNKKIHFKEYGPVDSQTFAIARQDMLEATNTDWLLVVDGDEVWWDDSIRKVVEAIQDDGENLESIVVPTYNLVGDIFHYQEPLAGNYNLAGRRGHLNLRGINRKISGLSSSGVHGVWGWTDENGEMIQDRDSSQITFVDAPYLHATNISRAAKFDLEKDVPKRSKKLKYELGLSFPYDFYYPEVLFRYRPKVVTSPWIKSDYAYKFRAFFETPLKKAKRRLIPSGVGY